MNELKKIFMLLVSYLLMVFTLGELQGAQGSIFQFPSHFYFLIVAIVFTNLFVPRLSWMSITTLLAFWAAVFLIVAYFYVQFNGDLLIQILGVEFILIEVAVWISYQLNTQLRLAEALMDSLASATYTNRAVDLRQATDQINIEMTRSRRHHHPLSVIFFKPERVSMQENQQAYQLMRHDLLRHFVSARIGQIMTSQLRQTDLIMRTPDGDYVIMCTETTKQNSKLLAERIQQMINENMGASIDWSIASFPDEALTFDELLSKAKAHLMPISVDERMSHHV